MKTTLIAWLMLAALSVGAQEQSLVNFNHLKHLTEEIEFEGEDVSIVHVYANYPTYEWVDAKESGPEGIACVDDAGRAGVLYLRHYELTGAISSLERAKSLLKFVLKMQADDGQFYNFIFADRSINREGKTSYKSFGWWAARAVWCMSVGYRLLKHTDSAFAAELQMRVERTFPYIDSLLIHYRQTREQSGFKIPQWLLYESAADATSELFLGLTEYYTATRDNRVKTYIEKLADGFMTMQDGDVTRYPFGLHRSWQTMWHMWGNGQTQGLAQAGNILGTKTMVASAEREAIGYYSQLLIEGFVKEMDVARPGSRSDFEQIAYGIRPVAVGLIRLHEATAKSEYLAMAGLTAAWLFGNNVLGATLYDTSTGRCFDGITDSMTINRNSGAESTIEALFTLVEIERYPEAKRLLRFRKQTVGRRDGLLYAVFRDERNAELVLVLDTTKGRVEILEGGKAKRFFDQQK